MMKCDRCKSEIALSDDGLHHIFRDNTFKFGNIPGVFDICPKCMAIYDRAMNTIDAEYKEARKIRIMQWTEKWLKGGE